MANIKDLLRMCECYSNCEKCELYDGYESCGVCELPDNAEEIVDEWVEKHPVKTYAMDFFEKFPKAIKVAYGRPNICRGLIYGYVPKCPDGGCNKCWKQEMKENA